MTAGAAEEGVRYDDTLVAIADFATTTRREDMTDAAAHAMVRLHLDAIGCAAGGFDSEPSRIARDLAAAYPHDDGVSVFGVASRAIPDYGVFANSSQTRHLDFNDVYSGSVVGGGHPSDMAAALFGTAEILGRPGADVVVAMYTAYEIYGAIADTYPVRGRGFDQGANLAISTSAGLGRLLGLTPLQIRNAISIALTAGLPLRAVRAGELSHWKGCAAAHATMTGMFATRLAQAGMTGPPAVFTGTDGFEHHITDGRQLSLDFSADERGRSIGERAQIKFYPSEQSTQGPIGVALSLRDQIPSLDAIEKIHVETYHLAWHEIGGGQGDAKEKWDPRTRESADHSLPYVIAAALVDGEVTIDTFDLDRVHDPALRPLMAKVEIVVDDAMTKAYEEEWKLSSRMSVHLTDGTVLNGSVEYPKGHTENPLDDDELSAKYRTMAPKVMSDADVDRLLGLLWQLDSLASLDEIAAIYRGWKVR
jgi:2-methylcitrate dehydratase